MKISDLKARAWIQLKSYYWNILVVVLILILVMGSSAGVIGFLLTGPLLIGVNLYKLNIIRKDEENINVILEGFKGSVGNYIVTYILRGIFVFLWSLLFIIPGIIKWFSYSMTFFILVDNPDLQPTEAIDRSREMMSGNKGKLFMLYLSFIGWFLLVILTFGIGYIFLEPYIQMTVANFYEDLKQQQVK
ncbi:MAG: DUF975 family protein [Candidatus Izemoplasmatales bacterium]